MNSNGIAKNIDGISLENTLFLSRIKKGNETLKGNFCTLHSLVYKIIRMSNLYKGEEDLNEHLSGNDTYTKIKHAFKDNKNSGYSKEEVLTCYYNLRHYKNSNYVAMNSYPNKDVIKSYQRLNSSYLDWEDSMQLATWYLKEEIVYWIKDFNFKNIVLIQCDLLKNPYNKIARDFFIALINWCNKYQKTNIYCINSLGETYRIKGNSCQKINTDIKDGYSNSRLSYIS